MRAEALDCMVYGLAAKAALSLTDGAFSQREDELRAPPTAPRKRRQTVFESRWLTEGSGGW